MQFPLQIYLDKINKAPLKSLGESRPVLLICILLFFLTSYLVLTNQTYHFYIFKDDEMYSPQLEEYCDKNYGKDYDWNISYTGTRRVRRNITNYCLKIL